MDITVRSITGFEEAFNALFTSKRTWNHELYEEIDRVCSNVLDRYGRIKECNEADLIKFKTWMDKLLKIGRRHITLLSFLDISLMTEGIHRAGQDDIDSHAKRFDNRIIRSSTRLAEFQENEMSSYYRDKIITTGEALDLIGISLPDTITKDGVEYVKSPNGYVRKEYAGNKDVMRGLYMLSIPSNFVARINLAQWAHVFRERNVDGGANPEVKEWAESVMSQITGMQEQITRDYVLTVRN